MLRPCGFTGRVRPGISFKPHGRTSMQVDSDTNRLMACMPQPSTPQETPCNACNACRPFKNSLPYMGKSVARGPVTGALTIKVLGHCCICLSCKYATYAEVRASLRGHQFVPTSCQFALLCFGLAGSKALGQAKGQAIVKK